MLSRSLKASGWQGRRIDQQRKACLSKSLFEQFEKLAAENNAQGCDRERESFCGQGSSVLIERQGSSGNQTMEMKMIQEGLVPGMQDRVMPKVPLR